jgi:hypothetical protein
MMKQIQTTLQVNERCAMPTYENHSVTAMRSNFPIACDQNNNFERGGTSLHVSSSLSLTRRVCTADRQCKRRSTEKRGTFTS